MTEDAPARVLLIAGSGRSGSTMLANLLGSAPGVFSGGEVRYLFERGLRDNRLCGCGVPFRDCPTWRAVLDRAAGSPEALDAAGLAAAAARWGRIRRFPRLVVASPGRLPAGLGGYAGLVDRLYRAIPAVTGASLIVDSSNVGRMPTLVIELKNGPPSIEMRVM